MIIKISRDFSETPGARYKSEGKFSGEEFREDVLIKHFENAKEQGQTLTIDFDGGYGYPTSFLEEAFGGLARIYSPAEVMRILDFISNDEPSLINEVKSYITNANVKR
ncbi:MAG: STAS-like domain-containing protein [Ruminococcus sp.]|nr:STAS-like domain-containing protein [Ruminococcus sp.]